MSLLQNSNAISAGGYDINNSLRFRSSASAYLSRTLSSSGNRKVFTLSFWIKRGALGVINGLFSSRGGIGSGVEYFYIKYNADDTITVIGRDAGSVTRCNVTSTAVFRDPSAWSHIVISFNASATTLNVYSNNVVIANSTSIGNVDYGWNNSSLAYHRIGDGALLGETNLDGYITDLYHIDGQALTPSSFGETDAVTGSWVAKKYTGTYGTNGFYLPFSDTETNENLLTYSEQFDNAAWVKTNATVTANTVTSPLSGAVTADSLYETTANAEHFLEYVVSNPVTVTEHTFSCYVKYINRRYIRLRTVYQGGPSDTSVTYDLIDGVVVGSAALYATITSVGGGWYRLSMTTKTSNPNPVSNWLHRIHCENDTYAGVYAGDASKGYYIFGAQVSYGTTTKNYIATTSSAITPRGTSENQVLYSEDATNAAWNKVFVTATSNTTTAPNGTITADSILETTANNLHVLLPTSSLTLAAANIHTVSVYVKSINNQFIQLVLDDTATTNGGYANYDIANGTVTQSANYGTGLGIRSSIQSVGSGWYRISLSTSIGSGTTARFAIVACQSGTSGVFPGYVGNASNGYYVWGMQLEENTSVGPYMPTTSSAQSKVFRIGADRSLGATGFGYNTWIPNNLSLIPGSNYDAMKDSPSLTSATVGNYCTLNPLDKAGFTIANGNLSVTAQSSASGVTGSIALPSSGKWYWECIYLTGNERFFGVINIVHTTAQLGTNGTTQWVIYGTTNAGTTIINKDGADVQTGLTAVNANNVIGIAYNADAGTIQFYNNNSVIGTAVSFTAGITYAPFITSGNNAFNNFTCSANFGQQPFAYTPPTGYKALNTYNLPDSTIKKGNKYMDATLYTGTRATQVVTNAAGFKPDMVWCKGRSFVSQILVSDSVRGTTKQLFTPLTVAEQTDSTMITAFNSNGFTLGDNSGGPYGNINYEIGGTHVAWQWQAGQGSTSTNTSGSITSTVSVSTTAGFSVVTWANTSTNATIGHGLGVAPKMIIAKNRTGTADSWLVYHSALGATKFLRLESTAAEATNIVVWNNTAPTSTVFSIGTGLVTGNFVAYCFAEIAGFSKFGSYTGNGSADGPFIYTGFRPTFIIRKQSSGIGDWIIFDNARNPYNVETTRLLANTSNGDQSPGNNIDVLSNGWKERSSDGYSNASGQTYIYMAFAENPFKNANAR